jgi:hypothetical protein
MNLKIVSEGSESIVNLYDLSNRLEVNSEIYIIKDDKEILLGFVSHSLLVYFCAEFAEYALQNYANEKIPKAEECLSLVRKWIENPNSISRKELISAADVTYTTAAAYTAYTAAAAADAAAYAADVADVADAAANAAGKDREKELQRQGEFIINYLSSNAWLFNL